MDGEKFGAAWDPKKLDPRLFKAICIYGLCAIEKGGCCCMPERPRISSLTYADILGADFTAWRRSAAAAKRQADEKAAEEAALALALKRIEKKHSQRASSF